MRNVVRWPVTSPGVSSVVTMARAGAGQIVRWLHCQTHIWKHTVIFVEKIAASGVSSPHRLFLALSSILNLQSCTVYHWVTQPSAVTCDIPWLPDTAYKWPSILMQTKRRGLVTCHNVTRVSQIISVEAHNVEMSSHTWSRYWDMRLLCHAMTRVSHHQPV